MHLEPLLSHGTELPLMRLAQGKKLVSSKPPGGWGQTIPSRDRRDGPSTRPAHGRPESGSIHVSSSRWLRLEEAEELDTSEEPLFRREPFMERMDLESASRSLGGMAGGVGPGLRVPPAPPSWAPVTPWGQGAAGQPGPSSWGSQRPPGIRSRLFSLCGSC